MRRCLGVTLGRRPASAFLLAIGGIVGAWECERASKNTVIDPRRSKPICMGDVTSNYVSSTTNTCSGTRGVREAVRPASETRESESSPSPAGQQTWESESESESGLARGCQRTRTQSPVQNPECAHESESSPSRTWVLSLRGSPELIPTGKRWGPGGLKNRE